MLMGTSGKKQRILYAEVVIGSTVGLVAAFLQMLEKIEHLRHPTATLVCNINSVFNCSNVLDAWQSSFFGFPNSLMCMVFFTLLLGFGIVGLTGGIVTRVIRLVMQFLAVFFLGFGAWYLYQSIYAIGAVCLYCLFCYGGVILLNAACLRLNEAEVPGKDLLQRLIHSNWDIVLWLVWVLIITLAIFTKFYIR